MAPLIFALAWIFMTIYFQYKRIKVHWAIWAFTNICHKLATYVSFVPITCTTFGIIQVNMFGESSIYGDNSTGLENPAYVLIIPIFLLVVFLVYV